MDQPVDNGGIEDDGSAIGHVDLAHVDDFVLGPLSVAPSRRLISGALSDATLEPKVMVVLVALARAGTRTLSKDDLIRQCWEGRIVGDASINRVISLLRTALRETAGDAVEVETIPKVGYRVVVSDEADAGGLPDSSQSSGANKRGVNAVIAGLVLAVLGAAAFFFLTPPAQPERVAIALLPFDVHEGTDAFYASGMTSELQAELARQSGLEITSPDSARQLLAQDSSLQEIGRALSIQKVLRGFVEADTDRTILKVEVVDVDTGLTTWQETFASSPDSAETLPFRAARELLQALGLRANQGLLEARVPVADFQLYLTALGLIETRDPAQLRQAAEVLGKIVERNPRFSAGWAARAKAIGLLYGVIGDSSLAPLARKFAQQALDLNPDSVEALKILGLIGTSADERVATLNRALELDPGDAEAWLWLGHVADHPDHIEEISRAMRRLVELDPLWDRSWQASYYIHSMGDAAGADRLDAIIAAAAAEPWQAELAEARIAVRRGDQSQFVGAARAAMPVVSPRERQVLTLQLINQAHLLDVALPAMPTSGIPGAANSALVGNIPSEAELDALGIDGERFFSILPFVIGGATGLVANGREAQLVRYYDEAFGSAQALEEFASTQLRTHHFLPQLGTYVGFALARVGREDEAQELYALAETSVARWNRSLPTMTSKMFEANLAAAKGEPKRAIDALQAAIELGWPYNAQSPGIAAQGPLSQDAVWQGLSENPDLVDALAPIRTNLKKERAEVLALQD